MLPTETVRIRSSSGDGRWNGEPVLLLMIDLVGDLNLRMVLAPCGDKMRLFGMQNA